MNLKFNSIIIIILKCYTNYVLSFYKDIVSTTKNKNKIQHIGLHINKHTTYIRPILIRIHVMGRL